MTKLQHEEYERWLAEKFEYNEDAIVFNYNDKEMQKEFLKEMRDNK